MKIIEFSSVYELGCEQGYERRGIFEQNTGCGIEDVVKY